MCHKTEELRTMKSFHRHARTISMPSSRRFRHLSLLYPTDLRDTISSREPADYNYGQRTL